MEHVQERRGKGWEANVRVGGIREQSGPAQPSVNERGEWARQMWRPLPSGAPVRGWGKRSS